MDNRLTEVPAVSFDKSNVTPDGTATLLRTIVAHDAWDALADAAPAEPEKVQEALFSSWTGVGGSVGAGAATATGEARTVAAKAARSEQDSGREIMMERKVVNKYSGEVLWRLHVLGISGLYIPSEWFHTDQILTMPLVVNQCFTRPFNGITFAHIYKWSRDHESLQLRGEELISPRASPFISELGSRRPSPRKLVTDSNELGQSLSLLIIHLQCLSCIFQDKWKDKTPPIILESKN